MCGGLENPFVLAEVINQMSVVFRHLISKGKKQEVIKDYPWACMIKIIS